MSRILSLGVVSSFLLIACTEGADVPDAGPDAGPDALEDCPAPYQQHVLPQYELAIAPAEWAALDDEFHHRAEREAQGLDPTPYHAADFAYVVGADRVDIADVRVRLKGQSSWAQTLDLDANPKMQFVISFNEVDKDGRFLGVRKVDLDMPRSDQTYLRHRLALRYLRAAGIPAQCANNARLVINGAYYGLYTNVERFDKELLQRVFGADDEGDLWQGGRILKTNEDDFSWARLDALWHLDDVATLDELADLDGSMHEWAAEAMGGDADGYYNGHANFYIYDHPSRGFLWMPVDLDTAFDQDYLRPDASPVFPPGVGRWERDWHHYIVTMSDPAAQERYVTALRDVRARYDADALAGDLDRWNAQIAASIADDPHRPFTLDAHALAVDLTRAYLSTRADYVDEWLACRADGVGADLDGDGVDACHDCDDNDRTVKPGAPETCNLRDDDCNGRIDDLVGAATCG